MSIGKDASAKPAFVRVEVKEWWKSKVIWFNLIALIVMVVTTVLGQFGYTGELPADWLPYVTMIVTLINLILRLITKQPLK